ncbi:MAG: transcription antitermination protein NusB, partial [Coriobacteriales bacterium]|nr:transcription antitermination protein NusB [Coriobacteriales bacterium]
MARQHTRFGGRTNARSQALQLLFQAEATGRMVVDVLAGEYALSDGPLDSFGEQLAVGADSMLHELDAVLEMTSSNWGVSRMPAVDRNLLRLAIYEMLEVDDVDVAITIDECVELAKAYGTDESS